MRKLPVLDHDDETLAREAAHAGLALRVDELRRIAAMLGRDPSIVEVHAFDAQWSEHCSYKSSRHFLVRLPTSGPDVMLGPGEDAGILYLGDHDGERYGIVIAHESHNHPSQVVPFEGAATGIGGIVRDVLCMGAQVIGVADPLRFGAIDEAHAHQRYVAQGVVDGISAYGNAIGVPNLGGDVYFDPAFDENALVNVVAMGLVKESEIIHSRVPENANGWALVLVGKATDPSGFGGASFSSVTLDAQDADANKSAVQVPDPFLKNVIMRASYRVFAYLRERGLEVGFKDLGAGGIMGCSAELVSAGGYGACIDLGSVNVALADLRPEVIAIGETQERLLWALPPEIVDDVLRIYNEEFTLPQIAHNARAVVIGKVTREPRYVLLHRGERVMDVDIAFLTGAVRDELPFAAPAVPVPAAMQLRGHEAGILDLLERVLEHRDVCSREPLFRRYDGVVRGRTVVARGAADAGVLAPIRGSLLGVALSVAGNPRYGALDPHLAAEHAVYEAVRNVVAVGATPIGLTDCLNFGNPRNPAHLGILVAAIDGLAQAARELSLAYVSGNVSLYNEATNGSAVPSSPIVASLGRLRDLGAVVTMGFASADSALFLLGARQTWLGGSVIAQVLALKDEILPRIDYDAVRAQQALLLEAVSRGLVRSAHDISDGGLLVALAEMAFACDAGLGVQLGDACAGWSETTGDLAACFGEAGGFVIEVGDVEAFAQLARNVAGVVRIGTTTRMPQIRFGEEVVEVARLRRVWAAPLAQVYA